MRAWVRSTDVANSLVSGAGRGSGKGDWADGEGGDVARGWRRLPTWARWGLIALAVVIALGWPLAPAARAVDLVANRVGRAAPDARVAGILVTEVPFSATDGVRLAHWPGMSWVVRRGMARGRTQTMAALAGTGWRGAMCGQTRHCGSIGGDAASG